MKQKLIVEINPRVEFKGVLLNLAIIVARVNNSCNLVMRLKESGDKRMASFKFDGKVLSQYIGDNKYTTHLRHLEKLLERLNLNKASGEEKTFLSDNLINHSHYYNTMLKTEDNLLDFIHSDIEIINSIKVKTLEMKNRMDVLIDDCGSEFIFMAAAVKIFMGYKVCLNINTPLTMDEVENAIMLDLNKIKTSFNKMNNIKTDNKLLNNDINLSIVLNKNNVEGTLGLNKALSNDSKFDFIITNVVEYDVRFIKLCKHNIITIL